MKKEEYYIGLDIGTDSVGWAATDQQYLPCKINGKQLLGIKLFDGSKTAAERRIFRTSRRRNDRKKQRIKLLQELFAEEISKVDKSFFHRLKESKYWAEDKEFVQPNTLFNDKKFSDKEYHKKYPSIYHLRKELIEKNEAHDVRLIYLALHHIIKKRGHFLFESLGTNNNASFTQVFNDLSTYIYDNLDIDLSCKDPEEFAEILSNRNIAKMDKERQLLEICYIDKKADKQKASIIKALSGQKTKVFDIFNDEELKEIEDGGFYLSDEYEKTREALEVHLQERFQLIDLLKAVYDWGILADILKNEPYISYGKVKTFDKHKSDLGLLKNFTRKNCNDKYDEIFNDTKGKTNYLAYVGVCKKNNKKLVVNEKVCTQEELCKYLKKTISKVEIDSSDYRYIMNELEMNTFLPKQISKDNGVIPYQVHLHELKKILENASRYLPFLNERDEGSLSVADKIISMFTFRIPYYVGPLNNKSEYSWIKRTNEKIYPWNFEQIVDIDASAEEFIRKLTNKCTYLPGEDVIPKNSLLYSEFMVLNEVNNLKINGEAIGVEVKQAIVRDLFKQIKKTTKKRITDYLVSNGYMERNDTLSGIDDQIKSSLVSYNDFRRIIEKHNDIEMVENIIKWIVIFGDDRKLLKKRIEKNYSNKLSKEDIEYVSKLKYTGWGRLSKEFLTEINHVDKQTGELINIITMLRDTNDNLMQLLSSKYNFIDSIKAHVDVDAGVQTIKEMVENLYVSPSVKRPIMQALNITKEIVKSKKHAPKKIFIEMARAKEETKGRTVSRKNKLLELYNKCKDEEKELYLQLQSENEDSFKRDRLYLYYTQMGRCMYSKEKIEISELFNENIYDVDHIYPQSKIKDDSIDNRVLVLKRINSQKSDIYPISSEIRKKMHSHWSILKSKGLISEKKYDRLTRNTEFTDDELEGFIARQIVETRQSTKAVAEILSKLYPTSEVVYVKANTVSDFRHANEFIKCRDVNDFHHARDAYLNIVVGNVYNTKYTHNKVIFIKNLKDRKVSLNRMFDYDTDGAWAAGEHGTIETVRKVMSRNSILFTRYCTEQKGGFFDQNIMKKGKGQIPLKGSDARLHDSNKYGKYNKATVTYYCLVEHTYKKNRIRTIEPVELYKALKFEEDPIAYCNEHLGLLNPKILIKKIKINTLFCLDGFYMHLSSKFNEYIRFKCAMQLCISSEMEKYIKNISKYLEKCKLARRELPITAFDKISYKQNVDLYEVLLNKLLDTVYNVKFDLSAQLLKSKRGYFQEMIVEKQCVVISEILNIIKCNAGLGDFSSMCDGKNKNYGTIYINKRIPTKNEVKEFKITYRSCTGLFEKEIDLLGDDFNPRRRKKR